MKTFKEFIKYAIIENFTSDQEIIFAENSKLQPLKYSGWDILPTIHAKARAEERSSDIDVDAWKKFMRDIFWYFKENKPKETTFKFYSKSLDISIIAEIKYKQKVIMVVTVLPKGITYAKSNTKEVTTESTKEAGFVVINSVIYRYFDVIILN